MTPMHLCYGSLEIKIQLVLNLGEVKLDFQSFLNNFILNASKHKYYFCIEHTCFVIS